MFWGFIKENGEKLLVEVRGTLISVSYINVLANNLLPDIYLGEIFQQDNAPCPNSQVTKTWMLENGIELLENWPPQSPDINIIENLWSYLKRKVSERCPRNVEELRRIVNEEFVKIPTGYIKKLYNSIPERLAQIYSNKGFYSKY